MSDMNLCLLLTPNISNIPDNVTVLSDYGDIEIVVGSGHKRVSGKHVLLKGKAEDFKKWLKPFNEVWVGHGIIQLQQFKLLEVSE